MDGGFPFPVLRLFDTVEKKLIRPGFPAAHPEPVYRCFLPDLTGFTGPRLRRTRAHERYNRNALEILNLHFPIFNSFQIGGEGGI